MRVFRCSAAVIGLLCVITILVSARSKEPEWLNGTSKKYPPDKYLIGVGIGSDLDQARANARAEIAKIFLTHISQSQAESTKENIYQGGVKAGFSSEANNELTTRTSTDDLLRGTEIAETYGDPKKKLQYALAVLDKGKMRQNLSREISDLEENIAMQMASAKKATSNIEGIQALTKALTAAENKAQLLIKRQVVDPMAISDLPSENSRAQIIKQRDEALRKIIFVIDNEGQGSGSIRECITKRGFNITASSVAAGAETIIAVRSNITVTPVERNNPSWKFCNWEATLEMRDLSDKGKIIAAIARQGQSSHVSTEGAHDKALTDATQVLSIALGQEIEHYFFGE